MNGYIGLRESVFSTFLISHCACLVGDVLTRVRTGLKYTHFAIQASSVSERAVLSSASFLLKLWITLSNTIVTIDYHLKTSPLRFSLIYRKVQFPCVRECTRVCTDFYTHVCRRSVLLVTLLKVSNFYLFFTLPRQVPCCTASRGR